MNGGDEVLSRVRDALAGLDRSPVPIPRDYHRAPTDAGASHVLDLFVERLSGYDARVHRVHPDRAAHAVATALHDRGVHRLVVPDGLHPDWVPDDGFEWVRDTPPLSHADLAAVQGVLTGAAVAVADSGTIVLDGSAGQGRRALSLLPDAMVIVVRGDQVVASLPPAIAALDGTRPLTFISGPSATVDIELVRVAGVHGPRALDVILLDPYVP